MGFRILEFIHMGITCVAIVVLVVQHLKILNLISALVDTRKSLNETREVVAAHEKKIKQVIQSLP